MMKHFWRMGPSIALAVIVGLLAAEEVSAQAPAPSIFSVTGVIDGTDTNTKTVVDILVAVPAGQDQQTAVDAALKAAGARAPEPRDFPLALEPFVLNGFKWPQFFDKNKRNNVATLFYNPTGDPTGGAALAAAQNAMATWSDVRGSSFEYAFGGQTSVGRGFDRINTISWANFGTCFILGTTTQTFNVVTGELLDADIVLNSTSTCGFSWRTDGGDLDVQTVLLHEFGHALGLGHSPDPSSIMYPVYLGVRRALDVIDVDGLAFLYPAHSSNAITPRSASVPFRLVAALGDLAPGGGFFQPGVEFEVGDLNSRGDASFASETSYSFPTGEGLFVASPHGTSQLERSRLPAPGGGVFDAGVVGRVTLNDSGDAAFASYLAPFDLPFGVNAGVYRWDSS
ncbi:MAG TPA: matrixin family metalloprotease, partial [Blastocatellia bacterium]|nr:matrixin family metalloprotease [Blastocatellia bacterium]